MAPSDATEKNQNIGAQLHSILYTITAQKRFLGRLPKVDLIILEGGCPSVRPSVRPQKVSSISMKFGIQVEVDDWSNQIIYLWLKQSQDAKVWKKTLTDTFKN